MDRPQVEKALPCMVLIKRRRTELKPHVWETVGHEKKSQMTTQGEAHHERGEGDTNTMWPQWLCTSLCSDTTRKNSKFRRSYKPKNLTIISACMDVENWNPPTFQVTKWNGVATLENSSTVSQNVKWIVIIWPNNSIPGYILKKNRDTCTHTHTHRYTHV